MENSKKSSRMNCTKWGYNVTEDGTPCSMDDPGQLDAMQKSVFDRLGYTQLANSLGVPLVNLHTGQMVVGVGCH